MRTVSRMDFQGLLAVQKPMDSKTWSTVDSNLSLQVLGFPLCCCAYKIVQDNHVRFPAKFHSIQKAACQPRS